MNNKKFIVYYVVVLLLITIAIDKTVPFKSVSSEVGEINAVVEEDEEDEKTRIRKSGPFPNLICPEEWKGKK